MQTIIEVPNEPSLYLRHVDYADGPALMKVVEGSRDSFSKYLEWTADADVLTILNRIEQHLYFASRDEGMTYCIVQDTQQSSDEVIGYTRLYGRYPHWHMVGEFNLGGPVVHSGFWLSQHVQGKGIMAQCQRALFQYAQERWGIENIFMDIAIDNSNAERSVRAIGAIPMSISYWQMQRPFEYEDPESVGHATSANDVGAAMEQASRYRQAVSNNTVLMQRWLLRLKKST